MNEERETRNSLSRFEIEGNVGNISSVYENPNGKKNLRFDLGQNNNGYTQFLPVVLRGKLVDAYSEEIAKGNWITIKGRINSYVRELKQNGENLKEKVVELLGFEITDRTNNKIYSSDGSIKEIGSKEEELAR